MTRSDVSGWLLVASLGLWLPAAALPTRVWSAPLGERLALIAERPRRWQVVNSAIAGAVVLLVLGFAALAEPLQDDGAGVVVALSLATLVLGGALWLAALTFRITAMVAAAGTEPDEGFGAVCAWVSGLFVVWTVLGNAAAAGFGVAVVRSGHPASWCGWVAIGLGALVLAQLLATGDALPALYHVGPALIGVVLLLD